MKHYKDVNYTAAELLKLMPRLQVDVENVDRGLELAVEKLDGYKRYHWDGVDEQRLLDFCTKSWS